MNYIVAQIHNNSLGSVISVESEEEGKQQVKLLAEDQLKRHLTNEELDEIEQTNQYINEEDSDNVWSVSVGIVE